MQSKNVDQTTAVPGDTLTYTMGVANDGTADATGVTATDTLPSGVTFTAADTHGAGTYDSATGIWSVGTVASGTSATLTITATVNAGTEASTQVNRFIITSTGIPVTVLDACSDVPTESCASTTIPGVAQLVQNKTVDQASAPVGATLSYTMTLANTGTGDATGVVAHDALPAGVSVVSADTNGFGTFDPTTGAWNIGTIAVGTTATLTVTATVEPQAAGSTLVNAFQVIEPPDPPPLVVDNPCPSPDQDVVVRHHHGAGHTPTHPVQGGRRRDGSHRPDTDLLHVGGQHRVRRRNRCERPGHAAGRGHLRQCRHGRQRHLFAGLGRLDHRDGPPGALYTLAITVTVNQGTDDTTQINRFAVTAPSGDPSPWSNSPVPTTPPNRARRRGSPGRRNSW